MHTTGIITDTNSGMTQAEARDCGVILMPMPFTVNGKNYVENVNMSYMEFFDHLAGGAQVATSQPSPEDVMNCWKKALETYEKLIYIPMSSALSSSCQSAKLFAEDFDGRVLVAETTASPSARSSPSTTRCTGATWACRRRRSCKS